MSVEALAIVLNHSKASGTDKVVLLGIANHDGDGGAWPTVATLARYANVTERNVQKALRNLEEMGELHVHYNAGGLRGTRYERPNLYDVMVRCPDDCDGTKQHRTIRGEVSQTTPGVADVTGEVSHTTGGEVSESTPGEVSQTTPEPSLNHPLNPSVEPSTAVDDFEEDNDSSEPGPEPTVIYDDETSISDNYWTERERTFIKTLTGRIEESDFNGADEAAALTQVRTYWSLNMHKPIPDWLLRLVTRRVRDRDIVARRQAVSA